MSSPERRPSADELDRLIEQVRRDPGSSAFVALGDAYLALGRPREAVEVGTAGLRAAPDDADGRVMVARALAALHQWKESQAELLRVVKVDRNHRAGFSLLGEVLLRRGDFERALPVLQHAQNLDPSNPAVLTMLRRARAGQQLDAPPPIPTPVETARSAGDISARRADPAGRPTPVPPSRPPPPTRPPPPKAPPPRPESDLDEGPTSIGGPSLLRGDPTDVVHSGVELGDVTGEITGEPTRLAPSTRGARPAEPPAPAPAESLRKTPRPSAPPPMNQMAAAAKAASVREPDPPVKAADAAAGVRPRVIGGAKQHNPAAEALRASASAGENYLNDLLTGGLLEVPGVRVPEDNFDIRPDKRWGRSAGRMFVALFVLLVLGSGAGVGWWYYSEQEKTAAIKKHREAAASLLVSGSYDDLEAAAHQLAQALGRDGTNPLTFAAVAHVTGLQVILYGLSPQAAVAAIATAERDIKDPKHTGWRELVIARAAVALATLSSESDADASLAKARTGLDDYLADNADDRWVRWLQARAMLAAGERSAARAAFAAAAEGDDGIVPAMIDLADFLVDEGKVTEAMAEYDRALARSAGHPLALIGQTVAWAERGIEKDKALSVLNVDLPEKKNLGPRVRAYRQLAYALAKYQIEEYEEFDQTLVQAVSEGPPEPRYLGRVALARLLAGDFAAAARARGSIAWFGKGKPESDPVVNLFDAALLVESGLPERALDVLGNLEGTRAHLIRAQANIDLAGGSGGDLSVTDPGRLAQALEEAEKALASAPDNAEASAVVAWAKVLSAPPGKRDALVKGDLNSIANRMVSKRGRHVEGAALFMIGAPEARQKLEQALANVDAANPNPIAYRTHTLLARIDLAEAKLPEATKHVDDALKANGGYLPAIVVRAKLLLAGGDAEGALAAIQPVLGQQEAVTAEVELIHAEALAARPKVTDEERKQAADAVGRARQRGAPAIEVGRVAALIDPGLPEKMGVPGPGGPAEKPDGGKKKRRR